MPWPIAKTAARELALDWDSRTIRAVMVRMRGDTVQVVRAAAIAVPADAAGQDAAAFGAFMRQALDRAGMTVRQAVICIPRDRVVLNTLNVPPTSDDELPSLVQFQIVKELPFSAEEATLDFSARGGSASTARDVLVAAMRNDVLAHYRDVASHAGLKLTRIGLRPDANMLAVLTNAAEYAAGQTLMVDIGPELTEINIISDGRLVFSRAAVVRLPVDVVASLSGDQRLDDSRIIKAPLAEVTADGAQVQGVVDDVLLEITRSVEAYRATSPGTPIQRIVLAGATGVEASVAEAIQTRFGAPTELYNPGRAIELTPARARELRGFSAALGLAMGERQPVLHRIDFLQPKKTVPRRARQIQRARLLVATAVVLAAAAYLWFQQLIVRPQQEQIAALQAAVSTLRDDTRHFEPLKKKAQSLEDWVSSERIWPDALLALTSVFPDHKQMYVLSATFAVGTPLDLRLRSADQSVAPAFIRKIAEYGPYEGVLENSQEQPQKDGFRFTERLKIVPLTLKSKPGKSTPARPSDAATSADKQPAAASQPSAPAAAATQQALPPRPGAASQPTRVPDAKPQAPAAQKGGK